MTQKDKIKRIEEPYLLYKKAQFEAIKDGLPLLQESTKRRMAAYWIGSNDAMIGSLERIEKQLTRAMKNGKKVAVILDRLPKRSYDLLLYVISESGYITMEELKAGFPVEENEKLRFLLNPLLERGLVWECRQAPRVQSSARFFILDSCMEILELPSYLEGKYGSILPKRKKEQLYNLVRVFDGDVKKLARNHIVVPWLKEQLRNLSKLRRFFDSLDTNERKLLKILALHPEGLLPEEFMYEYSLFCTEGVEETLLQSLKHLRDEFGLVDVKIQTEKIGRKEVKQLYYRLPREMSYIIRSNFKEKYSDQLPAMPLFVSPDEDFALGSRGKEKPTLWIDFQQLLNHLVRCEVGVIRKGGMHKKNLKRILDRLEGQPIDAYHYLDFLFLYAYEREIIYPENERWKINVANILLVQDISAFYRDFWAFYRNNASWNDRDSSPLQGVLQKGDSQQVFGFRRAILRMLWECTIGQWVEMKVFFDKICNRERAFRVEEIQTIASDPLREKYRLVKSNIERSLTWIGLVDTTTVAIQRTDLFRLTEIGAWLLGCKADIEPFAATEEVGSLSIQPNLEIIVPSNFPLEKQFYLARFTDDQKGRILLNRASIRRGLAEGLSIQEMQDFLNTNSKNPVPHNGVHLLEEVNEKAGHILIGGEPIRLEVNNHNLLDELLVNKQFNSVFKERDSEKRALLRRDVDLTKLVEELRRAGYTPRTM
ncbi:hypothetical protein CEE37_02505 [candidate division LCP-89 bacterium B3_LCP]|uniref:Helicase XPB/Ssl2 N-terminal domain-containing protein n=1 Tax=candidate division LCP-89 bacterium B3_LCP TaxID=2012998 RepID=A0A532V5W4_UNCL8|nr:MAG: hypothetical protein CEE37_02505 [candidate division LCP-89 bacterium B3_LCP]